ncbi:MAG: hypothetical protein QXG98_05095 [Candidatus Micrarchaeia archaeon]
MYEEDAAGINSEIRYITLELMKLAARKKKPFRQVAAEFIKNVYAMRRLIKQRVTARRPSSARE